MIVIALLAMLSLVGVVFYTFAAQERSNAEYFAAAAQGTPSGMPTNIYFDWALSQLIVGPPDSLKQSALWGGTHSLVPNMFGRDSHPYSGAGVNLIADGSGHFYVDQDYDGEPDDGSSGEPDNSDLLNFNVSPAARNGTALDLSLRFPRDVDVDYTYPDINNVFLSYKGRAYHPGGAEVWPEVVIPSFHRPQYLRSGGNPINDWYSNSATATRVMRPHPDHVNVADNSPRYLGADAAVGGTGANADFPFAPTDIAEVGIAGQMGVWSHWSGAVQDNVYELDVDNDGDGTKEGVWLDLAFPVQTLADGTEYIPLFSFTVMDADALLNLNVHGNSPDVDNLLIDNTRFNGNQLISQSSAGIDPSEINLQYAFHASPTDGSWHFGGTQTELDAALEPYRLFFGHNPQDTQELSNMEYFFVTRGRPEFGSSGVQGDVSDLFPGRYGELNLLYNSIRSTAGTPMNAGHFPKAGTTGVNDQGTGDRTFDSPRLGHPIAYNGLGSYWQPGTNYRLLDLAQPLGGGNPSVWLKYDGYQVKSNPPHPLWSTYAGGNTLMVNSTTGAEIDDAMEAVYERDFLQDSDELFGPDETAYAQMSQSDLDAINVVTRLEQLMPYSQGAVDIASKRTASKLLTADSWDRKQFGYPRQFSGDRSWEMNRDVDNNGTPDAFPPSFKPADWDDSGTLGTWDTGHNREPFRDELTKLLAVVNGSTQRGLPQFRLNLNRLLYSPGGQLAYRQLTDPADDWEQAQLDRQKMCRDIYVLLYTLGGGRDGEDLDGDGILDTGEDVNANGHLDSGNYADGNDHSDTMTPGDPNDFVYDRAQLRRMAQFAVNLVDAMDRDDVITIFEYDKNLGQSVEASDTDTIVRAGWNLDDDPLSNDGFSALPSTDSNFDDGYPDDSIERGVVHGVEAQKLTFSEALWVRVPQGDSDSTFMLCDEMDAKHEHAFIELRNASPETVRLAHPTASTTENTGLWRIQVKFDSVTGVTLSDKRLTFLRNAGQVTAGGQFTIGASNGKDRFPDPMDPMTPSQDHRPADLRVDYDQNGTFDLIAPIQSEGAPPLQTTPASSFPQPRTDLDLVHSRDEVQEYTINGQNSALPIHKGLLLRDIDDTMTGFTLILERRADLDRPGLTLNQNPWVEVDRFDVDATRMSITSSTSTGTINDQLNNIQSGERVEPLARRSGGPLQYNEGNATPPAGAPYRYNSFGQVRNSVSPSTFNYWQRHFDRDFMSVGELLGIPLYGPRDVTRYAGGVYNGSSRRHRPPIQEFNAGGGYPLTAGSLVLQPEFPSNVSNPTPNPRLDNRWYRLLEFVEVPTRTHTHAGLGSPLANSRVPGRLQLNMLRNPESLAGLIDDANVVGLSQSFMNDPTAGFSPMPGEHEGSNRDWWAQLIAARDRRDPVTGMYLPGTASSRPFRSLAYTADGNESLEHTILRELPTDEASGSNNRRLLEIGNAGQHTGGNVDPYIRHRLLSKVWGNTTNRSHVFVVFVSVGYFHAATTDGGGTPLPDGVVRVGDRLNTGPVEHKGVFVVDRSRIEEAYNTQSGGIDWRKLVEFRQTIK